MLLLPTLSRRGWIGLCGLALAVFLGLGVTFALPLMRAAGTREQKPVLPPLQLDFAPDEQFFVWMAWLYWVSDRDLLDSKPRFPEEDVFRAQLRAASLPAEMYQRHRQAFDAMGPADWDDSLRELHFISEDVNYGPSPDFRLRSLENARYRAYDHRGAWSESRLPPSVLMGWRQQLPRAELLQEFYQRAKLQSLWQRRLEPAYRQRLEADRQILAKPLQDVYAWLKLPLTYPVRIELNLLGRYPLRGLYSFSPWQERVYLKLFPQAAPPPGVISQEQDLVSLTRHELSHALLNVEVAKQEHLLLAKIRPMASKLGKALPADWREMTREWVADCIGYRDLRPELWERAAYMQANPFLLHCLEHLPAFTASGQSFGDYLPTLFNSFDPARESRRWQEIRRKYAE